MPQSTDSDTSQKQRNNENEECINFRPSPNFKHMKKYLKSKFEESANQNSSNGCKDTTTSRNQDTKTTTAAVQPPLPPNPPPPDDPLITEMKKEIEDEDEYRCVSENNSDIPKNKKIITEKTDSPEPDNPEETMCRNFIRGTCKRGPACIFAHKLILSQLPGVYTFCKNFQNSVCSYAKCKFVHATVFEKEYFFRTGYLPPHTMSHLKDVNGLQPPPPPPPPPEDSLPVVPPIFTNPPPPPVHPGVAPAPVITCAPTTNIEVRTDVFRGASASSTSPLKREWSDSDDFSSSPRDLDSSEPLAKKCKNCDNNEFRFQYNKVKVKKMMRNSEEMNKKIALITKKTNKLYTVLVTVLKSMKSTSGANGINNLLDLGEDKEKAFLEQLNLFLAANNRLSFINEDSNKNIMGNNFSNILAKHLLNSVDPKLSPDAS